jgi:hypothetical protein
MTVDVALRPVRPEDLEAYAEDPAVLALRRAGRTARPQPKAERVCPCRDLSPEHELFEAHGLDHQAGTR